MSVFCGILPYGSLPTKPETEDSHAQSSVVTSALAAPAENFTNAKTELNGPPYVVTKPINTDNSGPSLIRLRPEQVRSIQF